MFKLYSNKGIRTLLDESNNKLDIIKTMGDELKKDADARFMIIEIENKTPINIDLVNGLLDYALYMGEYNAKEDTCVSLKKFIVERKTIK